MTLIHFCWKLNFRFKEPNFVWFGGWNFFQYPMMKMKLNAIFVFKTINSIKIQRFHFYIIYINVSGNRGVKRSKWGWPLFVQELDCRVNHCEFWPLILRLRRYFLRDDSLIRKLRQLGKSAPIVICGFWGTLRRDPLWLVPVVVSHRDPEYYRLKFFHHYFTGSRLVNHEV